LSANVITFFNGGVGQASLVYHLAWMFTDMGLRVVAADLDPQANLTAAFLDEDRLLELWPDDEHPLSVFGAVQPLLKGTGDIAPPHLELIEDNLVLLVGDLALSGFEDELSEVWPNCMDGKERAFLVISAFWRIMQQAAEDHQADVILMDLGPNLGAINRSALISANYIVVPLSPDLFSLQGLRNLGPTLRRWRVEWRERLAKKPQSLNIRLPEGQMLPIGYIVLQHSVRLDRPVKAYARWIARIPGLYRSSVLGEGGSGDISIIDDEHSLALLKHYQSLMPLAQEAHKPMFHLRPADGAIGAHEKAVKVAYHDFQRLALKIAERTGLSFPTPLTYFPAI
jgi:cellulose biosynthesis protein BcsQ